MKWTNVNDRIPPVSDEFLGHSEDVLCQDSKGQTFIGSVRHDPYGELDPRWIQSGRDMYDLEDEGEDSHIVRWIPLREVVEQITMGDITCSDRWDVACPACGFTCER